MCGKKNNTNIIHLTADVVHGPDMLTVHTPPITVWHLSLFVVYTLLSKKNGCQQKNIGIEYQMVAISKMAAKDFVKSHF